MLNKLLKFLKSLKRKKRNFDPGTISDPVAGKTSWTPAEGGGFSFRTHRLVFMSPERVEFRSSLGGKLLCLAFLISGLAVMVTAPFSVHSLGNLGFHPDALYRLSFGTLFVLVGGIMFYSMSKPVVFDKRSGLFWKSWKNPEEMGFPETLYNCTELGEIHALQLVSEYWEGDKSSFYSYELNLVLHDGSRTNVVDHGDLAQLRQDAKTLSEFLGIPLWDGILE